MTQTSYNGFGDVAGTTDPYGNMSYLKYDNRGHLSDMRDPDRGHWTYSYDSLA